MEEIRPLFFRQERGALFACVHSPRTARNERRAALICSPIGHEYTSAHRALRQLAAQLARIGIHAVRFDYSGTGDSAGEYQAMRLADWQQDVTDAVGLCRTLVGDGGIDVIGLRLGATLALQAVSELPELNRLVLWEPVVDGRRLLQEWDALQAELVKALGHGSPQGPLEEVLGLPLTPELRDDVGRVELASMNHGGRQILLIDSNEDGRRRDDIENRLAGRGVPVTRIVSEGPPIWREEPLNAIVPFQLLRQLVGWLENPGP